MESDQTLCPDVGAWIDELMLGQPMALGHRALGVEFERLLLHRETRESAPLAVARGFVERMCERANARPVVESGVVKGFEAAGFAMSLEPGGQVELATPPARCMADLDRVFAEVYPLLDEELGSHPDSREFEFVALGHAPVTPVDQLGLLPRQRYELMNQFMVERGDLSRHMMRATAGFQLTYDVADRDDAATKLALVNRLTPLLAAWTANSRQVAGKDSGYASFRHHVWLWTDTDRSGIPRGGLDPDRVLGAYREYALDAHVLFRHAADGAFEAVGDKTLRELVQSDRPPTRADVDLHLTSLFPFVRLRNYMEVRCFDSVPWPQARSIQALLSGIVYCEFATESAEKITRPLLVEDPDELRALHERAARDGLDATAAADGGPTLRELGRALLERSMATLGGRSCDWAKPADLDEIRKRLEA